MNIAIAGTGYVGLSLAVLLAQHNEVTTVDIVQEKVDMIPHQAPGKHPKPGFPLCPFHRFEKPAAVFII